jgi:hypothetical protein
MADETENQIPDIPNLTDSTAEVREQFRRTETERARVAAAAQGTIPRGMVGDPCGAVGGAVGGGGGGLEETHHQNHGERMKVSSRQACKGTGTGENIPK